jgi:hypothetical protein
VVRKGPRAGLRKSLNLMASEFKPSVVHRLQVLDHGSLRAQVPRTKQWMMAGGELYALKNILGLKTIAMTQRYAHLSPAYERAMVDRMEQIWAKPANRTAERPVPESPRKILQRHNRVTNAVVAASV